LYKKNYRGFNVLHFRDKLIENHQIQFSYETIRKILIAEGIRRYKKRKKVYRRRRRMPKTGMLVQMDSSFHQWIPQIKEKWWLIAMIDDANNEIPIAYFFPKDTLFNNMYVIREFIQKKGLFMALYVDKASHFKTTRHAGIHYCVNPEQEDTQIERALKELNITLIPANSPQAKGRIERYFGFFQDRLINEMKLLKIKSYIQANKFLNEQFLPWYNKKYTLKNIESLYKPLPEYTNLDLVFCAKYHRVVNNDNTVSFLSQIIQIPPNNIHISFAKRKVTICHLPDNTVFILYKNYVIVKTKLSKNNKLLKKERKIEKLLNKRTYDNVTFSHSNYVTS